MPKSNLVTCHNPFVVIAAARTARRLYEKDVCRLAGIKRGTWQNRKNNPDNFTLAEIRDLDEVLGLTDEELVKFIRG